MRVRITKSIAGSGFSFGQGEELALGELEAKIGKTMASVWLSEASGLAAPVADAPPIERADLAPPEKGVQPLTVKGKRGR